MTSSVASERTPHPSSPSRYVAFSAPNLLKRFFLMCSGATRELLYTPSCITELNKYSMVGAIIFFTAGFAALSGGYAAYTAFRDPAVATALGVLWGLFIFQRAGKRLKSIQVPAFQVCEQELSFFFARALRMILRRWRAST